MSSEPENHGSQENPGNPEVSSRQKVVDLIVWKLIPIVIAVALAILYWPR